MQRIKIPHPIPSETCLACEVCCQFPQSDSFLSPFFTEEEIEQATSLCTAGARFRPVLASMGGQIVPVPKDGGFRCPFLIPETHFCGIYEERPLDCRLYPYALMLDPTSSGVWLGIDTKCPATDDRDVMERLVTHAARIWEASMCQDLIESIARAPRLVGPYQPDVLPILRLEELTEALLSSKRLIPWRRLGDAFLGSFSREKIDTSCAPVRSPVPLKLQDRPIVERYLRERRPRVAAQSFAIQFMAGDLSSLVWCETEGFLCLWAFDNGSVYMPLPPLGSGDFRRILPQCFAFMDQHNGNPEISRIENLSLSDVFKEDLLEFHIRPGYPDYVYRRKDLVELPGRAFHGKRSDWHAFAKIPEIIYRPYRSSDRTDALRLFDRWQVYRMRKTHDPVARELLQGSRSYHLRALKDGGFMGLIGRVIYVGGEMVAYTFGVPLNEETFVVALEVTDPTYRGASAYIFREFSRELDAYAYINVMDDSGLSGLRRLKRSYHPHRLEPSFVLYRK